MPSPFGDDRVEEKGDGKVRLSCPSPKGWAPRRPAGPGVVLHPGTAIRWEDELWEVVSAEETPGGVRYELSPWDERNAIRVLLPYDETSEAERAADARDVGRRRAAGRLALAASPVVGLLPGRVQERLEAELGIRASTLTLVSTLIPMAVGTFAVVMTLAAGFGPALQTAGPALHASLPLLSYFLPESFLRLGVALSQDRPVGSILGVPLYLLARATGLVGPPPAPQAPRGPTAARRLDDRFLMLEPLLSFLPVPDQERLRERFGFSPVTWGKRTAWFLLVYPGFTAPGQLATLLMRGGGPVAVLLLAATLLLAVEQVRRLRRLSRGGPAPSALGRLVAPVAAPLLR